MSNPPLAVELQRRWSLRSTVNRLHIQRLDAIEKSYKPTDPRNIGRRVSSPDTPQMPTNHLALNEDHSPPESTSTVDHAEMLEDDIDDVVEDGNNDLEKVTDFILTLVD